MAIRFSDVIGEVMPLVKDRDSSTPFVISRDSAYGDWLVHFPYPAEKAKSFLESQREHDTYAVMFKGSDFADGSFATVHDKVLCARFRAEYNAVPFGEVHGGEFRALINLVEDNIGRFSQDTIDYLLEYDNPLRALYDLNQIPLYNRDNPDDEPYDADRVDEFFEYIEYQIADNINQQKNEQTAPGMSFEEMIDKIRPEVVAAGDEPFLIYRDADGGWHSDFTQNQYGETFEWVEDAMDDDMVAIVARGQDFKSAIKQDLYNDVLCQRIWNEYNNITTYDTDADHKEIYALLNFFEDNITKFSHEALNHLAEMGSPLSELSLVCPYNLTANQNNQTYNEDLAPAAIVAIGRRIKELIEEPDEAYLNKQTQREVEAAIESGEIPGKPKRVIDGHYTEKFSIALAGREVFLAVDEKEDAPYLVCTSRWDNPLGVTEYFGGEVTADYLEAMREFVDRIDTLLGALEQERAAFPTIQPTLTAVDCVPGGLDESLTGKLVVIKPSALSPEYRTADHQLKIVTGGFGANPNSRGNAVFCKDLYSGKETRFERYDIAGVIDLAKLPNWAKEKVTYLDALKEPDVFAFGDFHFKPYRSFEKRDGDFDAQMRRVVSEHDMGISNYDWSKTDYSHAAFYSASGESGADIFKCVENGKLYIPCANELFRYNEPPVKTRETPKHTPQSKAPPTLLGEVREAVEIVEQRKAERGNAPASKKRDENEH